MTNLTGLTNVDEITNDIIKDIPEVTQQSNEKTVSNKSEDAKNPQSGSKVALTDKYGRTFDKNIHESNPDGSPKLNKNKKHIMIKKGYHSKPSTQNSQIGGVNKQSETNLNDKQIDINELSPEDAGKMATDLTITTGVMFGGEDWYPVVDENMGVDESKSMQAAYTKYFKAVGVTDIPPSWLLAITLTSYAMPRMFMSKTQSRLKKVANWFKSLFKGRKNNGARSNSGENSVREIDSSQGDSRKTEGSRV